MRLHTHPHHIGRLLLATGVAMLGLATMDTVSADPPGNNGTIKIDGLGLNDGPGHSNKPNDPDETNPDNDPHISCGFQVEFFNFDEGETANITFTAHPPTGKKGVLSAQSKVLISDDGTAGAPNDVDAVFDYDVDTDFDLTKFTSTHPVHGWHVKLAITTFDADGKAIPGGKKHKVFWADPCESPVTTTTAPTTTTTLAPTTAPPTTATVLGVVINRPATQVAGVQLPRTGLSDVLLMAGITALGLGLVFEALGQMAKRRSTVS